MFSRLFLFVALVSVHVSAQAVLDRAYAALKEKDYDQAIRLFQQGLAAEPGRIRIRSRQPAPARPRQVGAKRWKWIERPKLLTPLVL